MSQNVLSRVFNVLNRLEAYLPQIFRQGNGPFPGLAVAGLQDNTLDRIYARHQQKQLKDPYNLKEIIGNGLLWAVPKHRRSIEKRLKRKFGYPQYWWKMLRIKTTLRTCNQCGHDHEVGLLCPHCYDKVRQETQQMQDKIQEQLGLDPVDQEVVVLYEGEKGQQAADAISGKRIIEMPKPRPMWFSKNLMQKSTQQPANTKEVKPTNLG